MWIYGVHFEKGNTRRKDSVWWQRHWPAIGQLVTPLLHQDTFSVVARELVFLATSQLQEGRVVFSFVTVDVVACYEPLVLSKSIFLHGGGRLSSRIVHSVFNLPFLSREMYFAWHASHEKRTQGWVLSWCVEKTLVRILRPQERRRTETPEAHESWKVFVLARTHHPRSGAGLGHPRDVKRNHPIIVPPIGLYDQAAVIIQKFIAW